MAFEDFWERFEGDRQLSRPILDLGCGNGILTRKIQKLFPKTKVFGMDRSKSLLSIARLHPEPITWLHSEPDQKPPEIKDPFSLLISCFCLIHSKNPEDWVRIWQNWLDPSGYLLLMEPVDYESEADPPLAELLRRYSVQVLPSANVHSRLDPLWEKLGFVSQKKQIYSIWGDGSDDQGPVLDPRGIHLGRMTIWSLFTHLGQFPILAPLYQDCLEGYMSKDLHFRRFEVQFHLLRKLA
jgi:SAM-dependent methyltransferase